MNLQVKANEDEAIEMRMTAKQEEGILGDRKSLSPNSGRRKM